MTKGVFTHVTVNVWQQSVKKVNEIDNWQRDALIEEMDSIIIRVGMDSSEDLNDSSVDEAGGKGSSTDSCGETASDNDDNSSTDTADN
ncbi:hypothetical protein ANN_26629 [Periplaneta americana]|uniref:Uncharacterized protein n=1 Tax=Periplaneta americana TaxID=6978 RepID=A0ABQ8RYX1_PERAM|nr:hypothetical protein ANN_26629 [Periplaneta americana]